MSMNKKLRREKAEAEARGEIWTRPESKKAEKQREKRVGYTACWKETGRGTNCRMPKNHQGECR